MLKKWKSQKTRYKKGHKLLNMFLFSISLLKHLVLRTRPSLRALGMKFEKYEIDLTGDTGK